MSLVAHDRSHRWSPSEQLEFAREVLREEALALTSLADRLGDDFLRACNVLFACRGSVFVTGIGKAGLIGAKIAATLASTGTRAQFLHPVEALHGDLGRLHADDCVLVLSFSGETEEILKLLPTLRAWRTPIIAVTGRRDNSLARAAQLTLEIGPIREACSLRLAPSTSTTAMLALGDALALTLSRRREFSPRDFVRFHPGGSLGRKLSRVEEIMRPPEECRIASAQAPVREVFKSLSRPGRRTGAIMLVDERGRLTGIFTDSDLARLLEGGREEALGAPIHTVMTRDPRTVALGSSLNEAWELLAAGKLSELPVLDSEGRPCGLIDITDLVGFVPAAERAIEETSPELIAFPRMHAGEASA